MTDAQKPPEDGPDTVVMMMLYNGASTLRYALDSLAVQTFADFHLVIVDDCSADESFAIAAGYRAKFKKFSIVKNEKNRGSLGNLKFTLNLVAREAPQAKFFLWACSDDWWSPTYLEKTREVLLSHPEISVCQTWFEKHNADRSYVEENHLSSLTGKSYCECRRIFYPYFTGAKKGFYNQSIHGLIRMEVLRRMYPDDAAAIAAVSCTELSLVVIMLLHGGIHYHPEILFHKYLGDENFADRHPDDALSKLYKDKGARLKASLSHLRRFFAFQRGGARFLPPLTIVLLWLHLVYFYGLFPYAYAMKMRLFGSGKQA